ncbi:hypothetical protein HHK36_025007 [Tetracentron sinense]|uniref:TRF2/HOY1 PH-like domain-containing protein n=1 Tax=Tetracentron sinense TaxID=13715 RepID=A0A835D575_TETSI|nr:hypothetical protein HHK36_025007 [Tetracentron sinense]
MVSQNPTQNQIGTLIVSELDFPPNVEPEITAVYSSGFNSDASTTSMAFLGTQGRNILPIKLEIDEKRDLICQQLKLLASNQQYVYINVPENSSPLGLTLRKTPSFLDLVETKLYRSSFICSGSGKRKRTDVDTSAEQINSKKKASNFSASLLRIGSWERISRYEGELVAKCYYAKRKFVWEVLHSGLKNKIEVLWSDIASLKATCNDNEPQILEIELLQPPLFFQETNPQPRKHSLWKATVDFTAGQASIFRRHFLQFPQGTLQKHYAKLLQLDNRLSLLSKNPFPTFVSPFFGIENFGNPNPNPNDKKLFVLEGQCSNPLKEALKLGTSDNYSEQFHGFTLSRTVDPRKYSNLDQAAACSETTSSGVTSGCLGHGTSVSIGNAFPRVSVHPFTPDFGTTSISENCNSMERGTDEVTTVGYNPGVSDLYLGKFNSSSMNTNSTSDWKSNCLIPEIQTIQNPIGLSDNVGCKIEKDGYFTSGLSYCGEEGGNLYTEIYGNCAKFLLSTSDTMPFLEDQVTLDEVSEVLEWTPWM